MALLARGWGNSIQILAATRIDVGDQTISGGGVRAGGWRDGGGVGGSGGGKAVKWPSLAVVKELSASAPVVAVEWLREQVWFGLVWLGIFCLIMLSHCFASKIIAVKCDIHGSVFFQKVPYCRYNGAAKG